MSLDDAAAGWPQKIRLARKGNRSSHREGDLYIGRMDDAAQFTSGLILHVGFDPVPHAVVMNKRIQIAAHELSDGANQVSDWVAWLSLVRLGVETIRAGTDVLVTCDQGVSRSVTTAAGIISLLDGVPMAYPDLARELRNRYWDGPAGMTLPSKSLWDEAAAVLNALRAYDGRDRP